MGLLDGLLGSGWEDPRTMASLQMAAGLLSGAGPSRAPTNIGASLGAGLQGYQQTMAAAQRQKLLEEEAALRKTEAEMRRQQFAEQLAEAARKREDEGRLRNAFVSANRPAGEPIGDTGDFTAAPAFDMHRFAQGIGEVDPLRAAQLIQSLSPQAKPPIVTKPGDILRDPTDPTRILAQNAFAPEKPPVPPEIVKLIEARDSLPPGHPNRAILEDAIRKSSTHQPATTVNVNEGQRGFSNTRDLRNDYAGLPETKAYKELQTTADIIRTALKTPSPANDLAAATKFMKMLDPGSVVRESELAMAMSATGLLDRVGNYHNMLLKGEKLTPAQRKDFAESTDRIFAAAEAQQKKVAARYRQEASRWGLDPDAVTPGLPSITGGAKAVPQVGEERAGYRFKGGDPASPFSWEKVR